MSGREVPSSMDPSGRSAEEDLEDTGGIPDKPGDPKLLVGAVMMAIVAAVATWFFYTNRNVWQMDAEPFYALIFAVLLLVSIGYLLKRISDRRTWNHRYG